ncbi:MAG: efflux RND transporter periplasmic adaptor subunit [Acidobacteriota bacterium]
MKRLPFAVLSFLTLAGCSTPAPQPAADPDKTRGVATVEMKTEAQHHVGLQLQPVARSRIVEYLQVTGSVQPIDSRVSQVRPLSRGRVLEVFARVGDRVQTGQVLARIDNIEAGELFSEEESAKAELQRLRVRLASQNRQLDRTNDLVAAGVSPRKAIELARAEIEELEQNIRSQESVIRGIASKLRRTGVEENSDRTSTITVLSAPFAGVVVKAHAAAGEVVEPATELFTVADLTQVWVQAEVYEKDLARIRIGQTAVVTVDTYPGEKFSGQVSYISDLLDPQTRTARVRCELANPGLRLKLDMFASVRIPTTFNREAIAIPVGALQQVDGANVVFVQKDDTHFEIRPVASGNTVDDQIEITGGLREGERIVTQGAFHLKSIAAGKDLGEE